MYLGGILGVSHSDTNNIENCLSGGKITPMAQAKNYIGTIVGSVGSSSTTTISHCYWTSDVGNYDSYGYGNPAIDVEISLVSLGTVTMDNLNNYNSSWSKWFMLYLNGGNINSLNQTSLVVTQKHFPEPVKTGNTFLLWCLDTDCNEKYDPEATDMSKVTGLYASWRAQNYTITFDYGNGTTIKTELNYNETIKYPTVTREGFTLNWSSDIEKMPASDVTVVAQWKVNGY